MTRFRKPSEGGRYEELGVEAIRDALADAGLAYDLVQEVHVGYAIGDSCAGQRVVYGAGLTGVPIVNVNNACATGSTALWSARRAVAAGLADCALAVGFEQMTPGALKLAYPDRSSPSERHDIRTHELMGADYAPTAIGYFAAAAREYLAETGIKPERFAEVAVKARRHAAHNPRAVFRDPITVEEVMASTMAVAPLTKFQCSPPTTGAAAALVCSPKFAARHKLHQDVEILAQALRTDDGRSFAGGMRDLVGYGMARDTASEVYELAGVGPGDVQVVELHDCFTSNELMSYESLGLAAPGEGERLIVEGDNTYGGRWVVNPSGGLIAKGHPIGATGLAQAFELTMQLRGDAGARQVDGARLALQHNLGLGGACVVTLYGRAA